MALDVGDALRDGFRRATARNGLVLMVAVFLVGAGTTAFSQTVQVALVEWLADLASEQGTTPPPEDAFGATPLALPIPAWLAGLLLVGTWLVGQAVTVVAIRTFVSDATERIPREFLRRRIVWAVANVVVGGIVVGALVVAGLLLLVLPGLFLAVSFYFLNQVIAVEDEDFVDAMRESWSLAAGDRFDVFLLAAVLVGLSVVVLAPTIVLGEALPAVAAAYSLAVTAPVSVFGVAAVSRAYVQLVETRETADEYAGALGPEDLEEPGG